MSFNTVFNPNSKNCGGKHMIYTQQRNHLKAIVNSESLLKISRPHKHVDANKKSKKVPKKNFEYYKEIAKTFHAIRGMKEPMIDNKEPRSYYYKHLKKNNQDDLHNTNLRSMVKHLDEIETRKQRPQSAMAKIDMKKPFDMLPSTMYSGSYLEKSANFKKIRGENWPKTKKVQAHLPSEEIMSEEFYSGREYRNRDNIDINAQNHKQFLSSMRREIIYDSAASSMMVFKRKIYEYIIENKVFDEGSLSSIERSAQQMFPDLSPSLSEFFMEIKAFLKRPMSK